MMKALDCLIENPASDQDQGNRIDEGGENAHAMITKGFACIGRPFCLDRGKPRQAERKDVCQRVPSIGEQRQGMGQETAADFYRHNDEGEKKSQAQRLFCHAMCMIVSSLFTTHRISAPSCRHGSSEA